MEEREVISDLRAEVRRLRGAWRRLILSGLAGGAVGLAISFVRPPVFEARAVVGVSIQYGVTEPLELIVEDRALNRVEALMEADDTLQATLAALPQGVKAPRGWKTAADFRDSTRVDRKLSEWHLVVIDRDPAVAAQAAQVWAETAIQAVRQAQSHAWRAIGLMSGPIAVDCERLPTPAPDTDAEGLRCKAVPLDLPPEVLDGRLQQELALSRGILPTIVVELLQEPVRPTEPVLWARGWLVLGGALAGLTLAAAAAIIPPKWMGSEVGGWWFPGG